MAAKTKKKPTERYLIWLRQARFDLEAAQLTLEHGFFEWSAYQSVQAAEKALKAILVHAGWKPPRIHKLQILIGMCNNANDEFRRTKIDFRRLESFTFISRYPFLLPGTNRTPHEQIAREDSLMAFEQAKDLIDKISGILKHPATIPEAILAPDKEVYASSNIEKRLRQITEILVREFAPEKIILFGSFARKQASVEHPATIDILVIAETGLRFIERIVKARTATKGGLPIVEPLVYTPEEFKLMSELEGESFLENAFKEGKVLYEKATKA